MQRRQFLKSLSLVPALSLLGASYSSQLFATPVSDRKFLLVFLRGGYDSNHLLVPYSSDFYYKARPSIAIPKPGSQNNAALKLDADWALHPALKNSLLPLFNSKQLAYIPFAGTDDLTRSHFETQDSIEMGLAPSNKPNYQSGFLNRLIAQLSGQKCISFTDQVPLILRGDQEVPNFSLKRAGQAGLSQHQSQLINQMYKNTAMENSVAQGIQVTNDVQNKVRESDQAMKDLNAAKNSNTEKNLNAMKDSNAMMDSNTMMNAKDPQSLQREMEKANRTAINTKGFQLEARRVAKLMREEFNIGFIDVGGWDTHVTQGSSSGVLANRLEELGNGLATFASEMEDEWQNTLVLVISEFGRTFRENGNKGTDHGHGTTYWVMGGNVQGGKIAGEQMVVTEKNLFQNRDFPVLNNYRDVIGGLVGKHFDLTSAQIQNIFPGSIPKNLQVI